jgi:hypothetical protein
MEWIDRIYEIEIEGNRGLDRLYFYERRRKQHQNGITFFPIYQLRRGEFGLHHHLGDHLTGISSFFFPSTRVWGGLRFLCIHFYQAFFFLFFSACIIWSVFFFLFIFGVLERSFGSGFLLASFLHRGSGQNLGG